MLAWSQAEFLLADQTVNEVDCPKQDKQRDLERNSRTMFLDLCVFKLCGLQLPEFSLSTNGWGNAGIEVHTT